MNTWSEFGTFASQYVVNVLAAIAILVVGWIGAWLVAGLVRRGLQRTGLHRRMASEVGGEESGESMDIERVVARAVFLVLMVFVLVAVFETLLLDSVSAPLSAMLTVILDYAPRIAGALLLLAIAWAIATVLRAALMRGLAAAKLDQRLESAGVDNTGVSPAQTIAHTVYWLVFLLFLPAALGALGLKGILGPVTTMVDEVLAFLPNIAVALLILLIGWFVARLVQRIVSRLLASAGLDRLADRYHVTGVLGEGYSASSATGVVVHILIFLPVVVAALNALRLEAVTAPVEHMLDLILGAIPALFAAALLLLIAYFVGQLAAGLVNRALAAIGFDRLFERLGLRTEQGHDAGSRTPSQVAGYLVLVTILIVATMEALGLLQFEHLANLVADVLVFFAQVLVGLVVIGIGLYLANLAANTIRTSRTAQAERLALIAQIAIVTLALAIGLQQMGLADQIINLAFGLLLGAIAVAAALAFGLGGRDLAARKLEHWVDNGGGGRGASKKKSSSRSGDGSTAG